MHDFPDLHAPVALHTPQNAGVRHIWSHKVATVEAAFWGLLGTVVGAIASIATSWIASHSSYRLQREKVREDQEARASAFQRETLLELQEAIHDALRQINRAYIEHRKALQATAEWGKNLLPDDVNEGVRLAQRRLLILVERVTDDSLRAMVKELSKGAVQVLFAWSAAEAQLCMEQTVASSEQVFVALGAVLRRHR